ncbi:ECF RNA polymerase sigma factor SigK [Bogoriella caseilytica]|uniref:RNA polymerase ECF family sigma subunit n=1 Tax=Bogoriella caseilytica TaxID=56055 RepID=A0A3N2BCM8_9MICO|nr:ECF RNA polymerase sigma factor SigK [Bogoriella caseilytica]ROR73017.1 RNA polymerase ECF family sigma subunit [Bogoriella caseilytica]
MTALACAGELARPTRAILATVEAPAVHSVLVTSDSRAARAEHIGQLLPRVADGDQEAFAQLYDAASALVHGTALRVLRDPDLSADLSQEVMVEIWRDAARFDPARGSALSWIVTIARRRAVDRVRSLQSSREREARAAALVSRPFDEVVEAAEAAEARDRVRSCLGALTALQREAVIAAYYGGLTYREVADQVAASLAAVKTRIRDGLLQLRGCLGVEP